MRHGHWPVGTPWWRTYPDLQKEKKMSQNSDWEKLSEDQQKDVNMWRHHITKILTEERENFEKEHPELRMDLSFMSEPLIRADHPVILEEL